jgi:uncharacterized protein (TIGR02147 family)
MQSIFDFLDYRQYLSSYYKNKKETSQYFSYRYFALKIGINSPSFLKNVFEGKRNLTRPMTERFCKALDLKFKEKLYFQNLVLFNQAKTVTEKQQYYAALRSTFGGVRESILDQDQIEYFSNWYIPVVRELICLHNFKDDYGRIAASLKPKIEPSQAEGAIDLLIRLKLVEKMENGEYKRVSSALTANDSIFSSAVRSFTSSMIDLSKAALDQDKKNRHISGITMGISQETYSLLLTEIEAFKDRVKNIVNYDNSGNKIYQLNLSLFPLSETIDLDKNSDKNISR